MEPICFGIIKGEQSLIRASRASKVAGAFLVLFWHAKENVSGGEEFYKRHKILDTRPLSARETSQQTHLLALVLGAEQRTGSGQAAHTVAVGVRQLQRVRRHH